MDKKEKLWTRDFVIACLTYFLFACAFNLLMPTIPLYLSEDLGVSPSKIGIVLSSYALALLLIRPFCGYIVDIYERKPLFIFGITAFVVIFAGYYFAVTVLFFVVLRFIHGLFWGLSTVSANTVAIDIIPSSRRGEGIGYFGVNMNIAMAIAPFIAVKIYNAYDFSALITAALLMGALSIMVAFLVRVPKREKLDRIPTVSLDRFILVEAIPILLNQLLLAFGWGTLIAYAVVYGKEIGIDNPGIFFLFLAGGLVLSRIVAGKLIDRGYLHQVIVAAILVITAGYLGFALFYDLFFFSMSAFLIGIGYGTLFPSLQTIYNNMAPSTKRGTANSTYLTGFDLGIGIGMLVGAYLADLYGFSVMYLITALASFLAVFVYWYYSRGVYERYKLTED